MLVEQTKDWIQLIKIISIKYCYKTNLLLIELTKYP